MTDVVEALSRAAQSVREKRTKGREQSPECADLADQARREFGQIKINRMESLRTGQVWGSDPYANETWIPGRMILAADNFSKTRKRK